MGLASLSEWKHINCLKPSAEELIQDDILRRIIITSMPEIPPERQAEGNRLDTLLAGVDLDIIQTMDKEPSPRDFPGGTISFLFEKASKSNLEDNAMADL